MLKKFDYPKGPQILDGFFEAITYPTGNVHRNNIRSNNIK